MEEEQKSWEPEWYHILAIYLVTACVSVFLWYKTVMCFVDWMWK